MFRFWCVTFFACSFSELEGFASRQNEAESHRAGTQTFEFMLASAAAHAKRSALLAYAATMNFPINFHKNTYLVNPACDCCRGKMPAKEFVTLSVGATQDLAKDHRIDLTETEVCFGLGWQGPSDEIGTGFQVVSNSSEGQCHFNFCSTACLRDFLNSCVNHLEKQIEKARTKAAKTKANPQ